MRDWKSIRAKQDQQARARADKRRESSRRQRRVQEMSALDLAHPVGISPFYESLSPLRHSTAAGTMGVDPTKKPGTVD